MKSYYFRYFALAVLGAMALTVTPAKADLLPFLDGVSPDLSNGDNTWNYSVSLSNTERMDAAGTGNTAYFTIYDFVGYVAGTALAPTDWTVSVQNVGLTPPYVTVPDSASVVNLTYTYVGPITVDGIGQVFNGFAADSVYSMVSTNGYFSQEATNNAGVNVGGLDTSAGPEEVPLATGVVPEPSTIVLTALGVGIAAFALRRKLA